MGDPSTTLARRDVTACRGFVSCPRQTRAVRCREMIPGLVYLSSWLHVGDTSTPPNPEPYAYESAFAAP
jgi:hypothetical protein